MDLPTHPRGQGAADRWLLGLVLIAFGAGFVRIVRRAPAPLFQATGVTAPVPRTPAVVVAPVDRAALGLRTAFVSHRTFVYSHAACIVELGTGSVRAFWYAGTNEGTQDVTIQTAVFDPRSGQWSPERRVASRESSQRELWRYVKKVGNPVAARAADGALWLFYVTVSVGGWAGSSLTAITSRDEGETWSPARRIISSPFLNISTLVKGPPFTFVDGTMGLPVHHEFLGKFGELLRLDAAAGVLDKIRLSSGRAGLQPVVLIEDAQRALVLMRYAGKTPPKRVLGTATADGGRTWSPATKTPLANSNAALTGLVLPDGRMLVALNDSEENRNALTLVVSSDHGATWQTIATVEDQSAVKSPDLKDAPYTAAIERLARETNHAATGADGYAESVKRQMGSTNGYSFEFSYPSLIRTRDGDFHLVYTWNEAFIKHVQFSQAWLDRRISEIK